MTLIKKLQKEKVYINLHNFKLTRDSAEKFEKIADEFAIGFAEWLGNSINIRLNNGNWIHKLKLKSYTTQELLEIFKKEKGL